MSGKDEPIDRAAMGWDRLPDEEHIVEIDLSEHELAMVGRRLSETLREMDEADAILAAARAAHKATVEPLREEQERLRRELDTKVGQADTRIVERIRQRLNRGLRFGQLRRSPSHHTPAKPQGRAQEGPG